MALTDCPNPTCGTATVSHKRLRLIVGRDRTPHNLLAFGMWGVLLTLLGGAIVGALLAWPHSILIAIFGSTVLVFLLLQIVYQMLVRQVGIEVNRYRCSRCRYRWFFEELTPEQLKLFARKIEDDLPRLRRRGEQRAVVDALVTLGSAKWNLADQEQSVRLSEEGLALARAIDHKRAIAIALNNLGLAALFRGNHEHARTLLEECRELSRAVGEWQLIAVPLNNLGLAVLDCGDEQQAERLFVESLGLQRKLGQKVFIAWGLAGLAEVAAAHRQTARAAILCAAAQAVVDDAGVPFDEGMRRRQERTITATHVLLGETAFAAAWVEGRLMPQDKAIMFALSSNEHHEVSTL